MENRKRTSSCVNDDAKKPKLQCSHCDKTFAHRRGLNRHVLSEHNDIAKEYECDICQSSFKRKEYLNRHKKRHAQPTLRCSICGKGFYRQDKIKQHMRTHLSTNQQGGGEVDNMTPQPSKEQPQVQEECISSEEALHGHLKTHTLTSQGSVKYDPMMFLKDKYGAVKRLLAQELHNRRGIKWYVTLQVKFKKQQGDEIIYSEPHFHGKCHVALKPEDLEESLRESIQNIYNAFITYQREGSNWTLDEVKSLTIHVARYKPLKASSYIPLPIKLRDKHAVVNVMNRDDMCFQWAVLSALHPVSRNAGRIGKYLQHKDELKFEGIQFPMKTSDIPKFERLNEISVNLFGYEKGNVYPLHLTKSRHEKHVNLMVLSKGDKTHYCWIKNFNRLLHDQNKDRNQYHYCNYCLHGFTRKKLLKNHETYCQVHGAQKTEMPSDNDKWLHFKDVSKQAKHQYVVYADFECMNCKIDSCQPDPTTSSTTKAAVHVPSGFTYKIVGPTEEMTEDHVTYRGDDVATEFVKHMVNVEERLTRILASPKPLNMTIKDWTNFKEAENCHICTKPLGNDRVRDHDHVTGVFRGPAHSNCNLQYKAQSRICVYFHNLRSYDAHLIMQAIGEVKSKSLSCIPNNMEKYVSFSMGKLDFIDTYQFLNASLDTLVENLTASGPSSFKHLCNYVKKYHPGSYDEKCLLLMKKGIYPYEYITSAKIFDEQALPPHEKFYSSLKESGVTEEDYQHAHDVWNTFNIHNMGQYHDLYMETDVYLLADVFENFRELCLNYYGLDPAHFYTSPGLAWQACLKMTDVNLELLTDPDMHLFIEKGLRGGISMISHRFAKANNKYVPGYDPTIPTEYLMYLDANNLYGWAMSQALPTHDFKWLGKDEIKELDIFNVPDDDENGYILEVDLEYPKDLHDLHNQYPLAPEALHVTSDMLSPYQKSLLKELKMTSAFSKKLVPNLCSKKEYILHYRNLKQYLSLGMELKKIHKVISFKQSPWLKPYIEFNTEKRKMAANEFEKDFFKLMNNSVFGKTMENLRKRVDIQLVHTEKRLKKLTAKPGFKAFKIFNENLAAVELKKQKLYLNRPIYVGFSILDVSKTLMYDFHYNYMKKKYGSNANLLFTDTDSLCYSIQTDDLYLDLQPDMNHFDFSDYPKDHILYSMQNKKVLGKMKDEHKSLVMTEFVGLRAKMYSMRYENKEKQTAKGINKAATKAQLHHALYKQCIKDRKITIANMTQFRSEQHQIFTVKLNKIALSPYDDKRYLLENGISSLAFGHWRIPKIQ